MSGLLGAIAPETAKRQIQQETMQGVAKDAVAARMIADAAESGNPAAAAFADEAQEILGAVAVRRARARRLRRAAARAAAMGYQGLSRCGSDAALVEERAADRMAAAVCQAVRESHSPGGMGYISPEEQRLLQQKTQLESMTQAQLEQGFSDLLTRMDASAINFGADGDGDDEIVDDAARQIGAAAELFGGDLPAVFGASCYAGFFDVFKSSAERLRKRLARKQERLKKLEAKLESKEDAGKKGMDVKVLRLRINKLEQSIARIKKKLASLKDSAVKVAKSKAAAKKVEAAETQVVKEAIRDEDEPEDDEKADDELAAACEVFGLRPRRAARVRRRVRRLRRRAALARRPARRRRLLRRARRLRRRAFGPPPAALRPYRRGRPVVVAPTTEIVPVPVYESPAYVEEEPELLVDEVEDAEIEEPEEYEDEESFGAQTGLPPGRACLVGYFANRAALYGADSYDSASFGQGFFERVADWFRNLWGRGESAVQRHRSAAQAARAARAPLTPAVVEARRGVQAERKILRAKQSERREAARAAARASRRGAPVAAPLAAPVAPGGALRQAEAKVVPGAGGYTYQANADGSVTILRSPTGRGEGVTLSSGPQYEAILAEIGPKLGAVGPVESIVRARRGERGPALARQLDLAIRQFTSWEEDDEDDLDDGDDLDDEGDRDGEEEDEVGAVLLRRRSRIRRAERQLARKGVVNPRLLARLERDRAKMMARLPALRRARKAARFENLIARIDAVLEESRASMGVD